MSNYELIENKEFAYLHYLVLEFRKLKNGVDKYLLERDVRLSILLDDDFCEASRSLKESVKKSIDRINSFDIYNLDIKELEDLSTYINDIGKYFEYIQTKN